MRFPGSRSGVAWISVGDALLRLTCHTSTYTQKLLHGQWRVVKENRRNALYVQNHVHIELFGREQRMGGAAEGSARFLRFASPRDTVMQWVQAWRDIALGYIPPEELRL